MMTEIILVMNGPMTKSYRKLMHGQINDTKQNIPKRSFLVLSATHWPCSRSVRYIFLFCPRSIWVGRQKKLFFAQRLKKNFFASILMGRSGKRKQDYFFLGLMQVFHCVFLCFHRCSCRNRQTLSIKFYLSFVDSHTCQKHGLKSVR